jgi:hypothetical protein
MMCKCRVSKLPLRLAHARNTAFWFTSRPEGWIEFLKSLRSYPISVSAVQVGRKTATNRHMITTKGSQVRWVMYGLHCPPNAGGATADPRTPAFHRSCETIARILKQYFDLNRYALAVQKVACKERANLKPSQLAMYIFTASSHPHRDAINRNPVFVSRSSSSCWVNPDAQVLLS